MKDDEFNEIFQQIVKRHPYEGAVTLVVTALLVTWLLVLVPFVVWVWGLVF